MNEFVGYILVETHKAIMFQDHFWHAGEFLPKSQISIERDEDGLEATVRIQEWLCKKNDWTEFTEVRNGEGD